MVQSDHRTECDIKMDGGGGGGGAGRPKLT